MHFPPVNARPNAHGLSVQSTAEGGSRAVGTRDSRPITGQPHLTPTLPIPLEPANGPASPCKRCKSPILAISARESYWVTRPRRGPDGSVVGLIDALARS